MKVRRLYGIGIKCSGGHGFKLKFIGDQVLYKLWIRRFIGYRAMAWLNGVGVRDKD